MLTNLIQIPSTFSSVNFPNYQVYEMSGLTLSVDNKPRIFFNLNLTHNMIDYNLDSFGVNYGQTLRFITDYNNLISKNALTLNPFVSPVFQTIAQQDGTYSSVYKSNIGSQIETIQPISNFYNQGYPMGCTFTITSNSYPYPTASVVIDLNPLVNVNYGNIYFPQNFPDNGIYLTSSNWFDDNPTSIANVTFNNFIDANKLIFLHGTISSNILTAEILIQKPNTSFSVDFFESFIYNNDVAGGVNGLYGKINSIVSHDPTIATVSLFIDNSTHQYLDGPINESSKYWLSQDLIYIGATGPTLNKQFQTQNNIRFYESQFQWLGHQLAVGEYFVIVKNGLGYTFSVILSNTSSNPFEIGQNTGATGSIKDWFERPIGSTTSPAYKFGQFFSTEGYTMSYYLDQSGTILDMDVINTSSDSKYNLSVPIAFWTDNPPFTQSNIISPIIRTTKVFNTNYETRQYCQVNGTHSDFNTYRFIREYDINYNLLATNRQSIVNGLSNSVSYNNVIVAAGPKNITDSGYNFNVNTKYYDIIVSSDTSINNYKMASRFEFTSSCSIFPNIRIMFLNRDGGYDYWNFIMNSQKISNIERKEFKRLLPYNYKNGDRQSTVYDEMINETYIINSDWVSEDEYTYLEQLVISPDVYVVDETNNLLIPIVILDATYESKSAYREKIFNLVLNYKLSYNINIQNL